MDMGAAGSGDGSARGRSWAGGQSVGRRRMAGAAVAFFAVVVS